VTGGAAGRGDQEDEAPRTALAFEDDAWLDDEDMGPGVIR
jgi:hypothetical protein